MVDTSDGASSANCGKGCCNTRLPMASVLVNDCHVSADTFLYVDGSEFLLVSSVASRIIMSLCRLALRNEDTPGAVVLTLCHRTAMTADDVEDGPYGGQLFRFFSVSVTSGVRTNAHDYSCIDLASA